MVKISEVSDIIDRVYKSKRKFYVVFDESDDKNSIGLFLSLGNSTKFSTMESLIGVLRSNGYVGSISKVASYYDQSTDKQITHVVDNNPSQYDVDLDNDPEVLSTEESAYLFLNRLKSELIESKNPDQNVYYSLRITRLSSLLQEFDQGKYSWESSYIRLSSEDPKSIRMYVMSKFSNYDVGEYITTDGRSVQASFKIGILITDE